MSPFCITKRGTDLDLKEIEKKIEELVPSECKLVKVEAEGLDIVI